MFQRNQHSLHEGAALEAIASTTTDTGIEFVVVRVRRGRDEYSCGLHAYPTTFTLGGGFDEQALLSRAGFAGMQPCSFTSGRQCAVKEVPLDLDLKETAEKYAAAKRTFNSADQMLQRCGFTIANGEASGQRWLSNSGDGHTGSSHQHLKTLEDEMFRYELTWMEDRQGGGWTTHCIPKTEEAAEAIRGLSLHTHRECAVNDFEPCFWRRHLREGGRLDMGNNSYVFGYFDALPANLGSALNLVEQGDAPLRGFATTSEQSEAED